MNMQTLQSDVSRMERIIVTMGDMIVAQNNRIEALEEHLKQCNGHTLELTKIVQDLMKLARSTNSRPSILNAF